MTKNIYIPKTDLSTTLAYLSKHRGKMEVVFKESDNPDYNSVCLVFIKIPVEKRVLTALEGLLVKYQHVSLVKGKLTIDKYDTYDEFVGIIRIKQIAKINTIIHSIVSNMRYTLKKAHSLSTRDDIGNRIFPVMQNTYQRDSYERKDSSQGTSKY